MDSLGFLDFKQISQTPFKNVFNSLGIQYREENGKLIADNVIVDVEKNLYFNPHNKKEGGSVIVFVSNYKVCSLREAAFFIKELAQKPDKQIPALELVYHPFLENMMIPEELCKSLGVGFCKQKSIMNGRICFKVGEHYIGFHPEKKNWYFPKNFKVDTLWNIDNCYSDRIVITVDPLSALLLISAGLINTASIMRESMTEAQKEILAKYKYILFLKDNPAISELAKHSFVKVLDDIKLSLDDV